MFHSWIAGFHPHLKNQILVAAAALLFWALWLNQNGMVFNKAKAKTFMEVIFRMTYWTRTWSMLHKQEEAQEHLKNGCRKLETVIMEFFARFGWKFTNRIEV